MEFDANGNLILPSNARPTGKASQYSHTEITKDTEYLWIFKAIQDLPFPVGKKLLVDFITGEENNKSISGCKLYNNPTFGCLAYSKDEVEGIIDRLLLNGMLNQVPSQKNKFWKVLNITNKGQEELRNPTLNSSKPVLSIAQHKTIITDKERAVFQAFGEILGQYNDEQKKGIISAAKKILCLAGAGSGKTTVLTKRIEFLIRYKSINPNKILAITFTRKARKEMEERLTKNGIYGVRIETFNSFCEKTLRNHNDQIYGREMRVISYKDKILLINRALSNLNLSMQRAIYQYFTPQQRRGKTKDQLTNIFRNDCFFVRDYLKFKNEPVENFDINNLATTHQESANIIFSICKFLDRYMKKQGLRDFADQLIDTIKFYKEFPSNIPTYDHVLVDEYQDVNSTQIELINLINPENLFCVGDPRQSIYGWRGSNIKYILNFKESYPEAEIIALNKNYRSSPDIVNLFNKAIEHMKLDDLEATKGGLKDIKLIKFKNDTTEHDYIAKKIKESDVDRNEIFILARTNRILNKISDTLKRHQIKHILRSEETNRKEEDKHTEGKITLATIHAIKGLEAEMVFVAGCNGNSFPCRASEHPVIEMVKIDEYDKEEEEKRLFYVALSRAKKHLYLTHTATPTYFITSQMKSMFDNIVSDKKLTPVKSTKARSKSKTTYQTQSNSPVLSRLKNWRLSVSKKAGIPAFMVLHNSTLEEIARKMPMSLADLENITGMGPMKVTKYGDQILNELF